MQILDILKTRRSIRKYTSQEVPDEMIRNLLEAGMYAPSAGNQQPWHFVVIRQKETLQRVTDFHPNAKMLPGAQVAILVCGDHSLETKKGYWMVDCAAATQNILIAAHGMGLGAVWLGIYPREERMEGMRKLTGLPAHVDPFSLIAIGYPAEQKPVPSDRIKPERIHYETLMIVPKHKHG